MSASRFAHLHLHSQYSLIDGCIRLKELMPRLKAAGMEAVALTDYGNLFGAVDFYKKAKAAGIKAIIGCEIAICEGSHRSPDGARGNVVLLARNQAGYHSLRELVSMAWLHGLHRGVPHIDFELLAQHREGLVGLSTMEESLVGQALIQDRPDHARQLARRFVEAFEPGGFYLEVAHSDLPHQARINAGYRAIGTELNIPLAAGNNCHYLDRKDARAHEVLRCVRDGRTLDDRRGARQPQTDHYWLKTPEVMQQELGPDFADALENSARIAEACEPANPTGEIHLPTFQVPEGEDLNTFLRGVCREGLAARFAEFDAKKLSYDPAAYHARLELEVNVIIQMGFPGYFLIVQDFINWAKNQDIPVGPGRGSGAGSLVAYALRITDLDPLPYNLLFERFLNPERVSMPDFDIDFCMNRRGEVIDYVTRKYGDMNVGQIATFGSLKARGVIKDVGRVLGFSFGDTDRLSKLVPEVLGISLKEAIDQEPRLKASYDEDARTKDLLDIALQLEGLYRNVGMHAAGVVIGDQPLWAYVPLCRGAHDELVTQFAKDEVEEAGLVKFDFLGLKTLTVIDVAARLINRGRPIADRLDLSTLTFDDPGVYELIGRGDTEGVFQLESSGFQEMLKKMRPDVFEDIVAAVALYRPGPMGSGMHTEFINRKHGKVEVTFPHACLEGILKDTYGVIVYQEQVMQIAQVMSSFTLGGADLLRRAMGKKKADVMAAQRALFAAGARENGIEESIATGVFDLMEQFAAYGFNKSHSAAYAVLTYQTGWLKVHHKEAFYASVLTNDRDNADKVAKGIRNARKIGIAVLPPDVNRSVADFDVVTDAQGNRQILFGMAGVKGVGGMAVEAIEEARTEGGRFVSFFDFCERVDLKRVNKKTIEALIKTGAFDVFGHPRARLAAVLDVAVDRAQQVQRDKESGQSNLFALFDVGPKAAAAKAPTPDDFPPEVLAVGEWAEQELLAFEKEVLGFYVSGHPLDRFAQYVERFSDCTVEQLPRRDNYDTITLAGIVQGLRVRPLRSGDGRMGIAQFEDLTGGIEIICMGDELVRYEALLSGDEPLLVTGQVRIDRDEDGNSRVTVRIGRSRRRGPGPMEEVNEEIPLVQSLSEVRRQRTRGIELEVDAEDLTLERVHSLRAVLMDPVHAGHCETRLKVRTPEDVVVNLQVPDARLSPSDALTHAVRRLFDGRVALHTR